MKYTGIFKDFYPKDKDCYHKAIRNLHIIYTIVSVIVIVLTVMDVFFSVHTSDHTKVYVKRCDRSANYPWNLINSKDPKFCLGFAQMEGNVNFSNKLVMSLDNLIYISKELEEKISKISLATTQSHTTNITTTKKANRRIHSPKIWKVEVSRKHESTPCCCRCKLYVSDTCANFN